MVKTIFNLCSLVLIVGLSNLSSQVYIALGGNYSSVAKSTLDLEPMYQTNPAFGIGRVFSLTDKLHFNTEIQYSVKGFKTKGAYIREGTLFVPNANSNYRVHYMDFTPHLELSTGQYVSVLAGVNAGLKLLETYNDITLEELNLPDHKKYDFGYLVGGKISYQDIWLRLMVNVGVVNMLDNSPTLVHESRNIQMTVGVNLNQH